MIYNSKKLIPPKIEKRRKQPFSKPEEFEPAIRDSFDISKRLAQKRAKANEKYYKYLPDTYQGQVEKRRREALKNSLSSFLAQYTGPMTMEQAAFTWIELNAPLVSFTALEQNDHVLYGAAIWILDRISEMDGWRKVLFPALPQNESEIDEFFEPDIWDTQYDYKVIASVVSVLYYRNLTASKKKYVVPDSLDFYQRGELHDNNPYVLTSEYAATHCLGGNWRSEPEEDKYRERFRALLALVPQDAIDTAVKQFTTLWREWIALFFSGIHAMNRDRQRLNGESERVAVKFNQVVDEIELNVNDMEKRKREKSVRKKDNKAPAINPLLMNPPGKGQRSVIDSINPLLNTSPHDMGALMNSRYASGDVEMDVMMQYAEKLYMKLVPLEERFEKLQDEIDDIYRRERTFTFQMSQFGRISDGLAADLPDALQEPLYVSDPYSMCFALLYLIETGSDIPWLYGPTYGTMAHVTEALPWGIHKYEEELDDIWFSDVEYDREVPKTVAIPDWNERKYTDKTSDYYFPRSLAQILYEQTGCILPRKLDLYYPIYTNIRDYGARGKDASNILLLSAVLGTARRQVDALNFDEELIRRWVENGQGEQGTISEKEENETETNEAEVAVKDEKDILIDQLKDELKQMRSALHTAEADTRNTRKELFSIRNAYERERRELADLREIVFTQENQAAQEDEQQDAYEFPYETAKRTVIFGGHDSFLKAIRPMLPSVKFVDPRNLTFSPELVRNADIVWVQTNAMSHSMYWTIVKYAKQYNVQMRYFLTASATKCAKQVVRGDGG